MRKFLKYLMTLISPSIFLISIVLIFVVPKNYYSDLEFYQNEKNKLIDNNSTVFFGDSSCGNGVDAKLFGQNTYNLSLTGSYITCGTLVQLNKLIDRKKTPKKIILMYTIDGYNRSSIPGYKLDNNTFRDHFYIKIRSFKDLIKKVVFRIEEPRLVIDFKNDYIKQRESSVDYYSNEIDINLSNDNKKCIIEISNLCKKYNIDYTFMIGPNINLIDKSSLFEFKKFFETNQIKLNTEYYKIPNNEIGDSNDHISPVFKSNSTKFYKGLIE